MAKVLIIDDEPSICWGLEQMSRRMGHEALIAPSAEEGLELVKRHAPDVIFLDVRLPGMSGLEALDPLRVLAPQTPVVVMTAFGDLETAVTAIRKDSAEYIVKPFDLKQASDLLQRLLQSPSEIAPQLAIDVEGLVGRTPAIQEVFRRIALAAPSTACVLITGESGTGKELVARAIHRYSRREKGRFTAVNLAALSEPLAESELFGHVKGAFTGAEQARRGLLVDAAGGTLFLDEVAEIPISLQVKLLRTLEQSEVLPVGSGEAVSTDYRLITATHQDLQAKVREGSFRHDLFFRLNTFNIHLPPLRERSDDVPLLVEYFVRRLMPAGTAPLRITVKAMEEATRRPWWGNIRELRNAVEHALVMARDGYLREEHWPEPLPRLIGDDSDAAGDVDAALRRLLTQWTNRRLSQTPQTDNLFEQFLAVTEPAMLKTVLAGNKNQCAAAARVLGLHRTTLRKKLDQYGLAGEE